MAKRVPTPRNDYDALLAAFAALTQEADALTGRQGTVGVGIPGMRGGDDGALFTANLPATMGKPLQADLQRLLQRDVRMTNDANCFALSEAWEGIPSVSCGVGADPWHRCRWRSGD